jgi:hypothetical protein
VDIVVNDAEFQRFQALFNNYKAGLAATPAAWTAANTAAAATTGAIAAGAQGLQHHVVLINQAATASKAAAAHTVSQAGAWHSMARDARSFAGHIFEATRSLLRWGELTGVISGILGGGGLFGIDRLAINAGERRKSALGLGVSPGEESAFKLNYGRILDSPDQFLQNINTGKLDYTSDQYRALLAAGVKTEGKDTFQIGTETISAMKKLVDSVPENGMFGKTLEARGATSIMSIQDLQRLKHTPADEVAGYRTSAETDKGTLNLTAKQTKIWQDLGVQLNRAGQTIETSFERALTPLAPSITALSGTFTKAATDIVESPEVKPWITSLKDSLNDFDDYLKSPQFKEDMHDFATNIGQMAKGVKEAWESFKPVYDWMKKTTVPDEYDPQKLANQAGAWLREKVEKLRTGDADTLTGGALGGDSSGPGGGASGGAAWIEEFKQWLHDRPKGQFSDPSGEWGPPTGSPASFRQLEGQQGLPTGLLGVVYKTESNNNPNAVSRAGAKGGFQFMDATAREYGVSNPFDLNQAAPGASRYLKDLLSQFHGDIAKTAAGYNWGQGNVEKDIRQYGERWREHLPDETKSYVSKIERGLGGAAANGMKRATVDININNATGANVTSSIAQLAV